MGMYINQMPDGTVLPAKGKAEELLKIPGAKEVPASMVWPETKWEEGIVCVVDNGRFEAAGYAFDPEELKVFVYSEHRPKRWLIIPNAKELAK